MNTGSPFRNRKQPIILFELLIALSLSAILLTFLFSFLVQSAKIERKLELARTQAIQRGHLYARLQNVFASIDRLSTTPYFYTEEDPFRLLFQFDNGIDPDPDFSGPLMGEISLDAAHRLQLKIWPPREKDAPWRSEVLHPHIKEAVFEFLGPASEKFAWRHLWPAHLQNAPGIIRLYLCEEGEKESIRYAFLLPTVEGWVSYQGAS